MRQSSTQKRQNDPPEVLPVPGSRVSPILLPEAGVVAEIIRTLGRDPS